MTISFFVFGSVFLVCFIFGFYFVLNKLGEDSAVIIGNAENKDEKITEIKDEYCPVLRYRLRDQEREIVVNRKMYIGSGKDCDIVINHRSVSERHAVIYPARKHLGTINGKKRIFIVKNLDKGTPIEYCIPEREKIGILSYLKNKNGDIYEDLEGKIILAYENNYFRIGSVNVEIKLPTPEKWEESTKNNNVEDREGVVEKDSGKLMINENDKKKYNRLLNQTVRRG